jgi:hypothetical protein
MKNTTDTPPSIEQLDPREKARELALEVNRLHAEVERLTTESKESLNSALAAAWRAGQLLLTEKRRVRRMMGGAWLLWLEQNFRGSERTAQNYMRLADSVPDVSALQGLSLRQVYLRLGIATEPKSRVNSPRVEKLPPHVRLANKLLVVLSIRDKAPPAYLEQRAAFQQDLRALYERLRRIFEAGPANLTGSPFSKRNQP